MRKVLLGLLAFALATSIAYAIPPRLGFFGWQQVGYFPLSHSMQMSSMTVIYPSSSANVDAVADWAYWDGTTGFYLRQRPIVGNGRWPFVYTLLSGPPGMTIGATAWNLLWNGSPSTQWAAGYGVVEWTPNSSNTNSCVTGNGWVWTGSSCTGTGVFTAGVEVQVCDQNNQGGTSSCVDVSWPLTIENSHFYFVNADTSAPLNGNAGADVTNCGTISSPCATLGYAAGINGAAAHAPAGSTVVMRGANAMYWIPPTVSSGTDFVPNGSTGPASYIGMPGDLGSATLDLTGQVSGSVPNSSTLGTLMALGAGDLFFGNLTLYGYPGYNPSTGGYGGTGALGPLGVANFRPFFWNTANRNTLQGVTWNAAGYGSTAGNNASMVYVGGGSSPTQQSENFTMTGCFENGREASNNDNNAGMALIYGIQNSAIEMTAVVSPNTIGNAYYVKVDDGTITVRDNFASAASGNSAYEIYGPIYYGSNNIEVSYNVSVGFSNTNIGQNGNQNFGQVDYFRNNFVTSSNGWVINSSAYNLTAPYTWFNISAGGGTLNGTFISAPSYTTGGTLSGIIDYALTTLGVTGESSIATGNAGSAIMPLSFGSNNKVTFSWYGALPGNSGFNLYRDPTGNAYWSGNGSISGTALTINSTLEGQPSVGQVLGGIGITASTTIVSGSGTSWQVNNSQTVGSESMTGLDTSDLTQYTTLAANTASFTDPGGLTWSTGTGPPTTGTALSTYRFLINSNLMQTPTQAAVPTGNTIVAIGGTGPNGTSGNNNVFATSGLLNTTTGLQIGSTYLCVAGAETGC